MPLRSLPHDLKDWHGKRVLLRVDWNIPLEAAVDPESELKIARTIPTIHRLQQAGAIVVCLTHLGRPTSAKEAAFSTKKLLPFLVRHRLKMEWMGADVMSTKGRHDVLEAFAAARPGSVFLLENTRFYAGEEKNAVAFSKALATLGDVFVNEAFGACHREHASVVGIAKLLPAYAGLNVIDEIEHLQAIRTAKKTPTIGFFGGKKISSKLPALEALQKNVDALYLGGAMAVACEAARGKKVGASYIEPGQAKAAQALLKRKNVHLPVDYVVVKRIEEGAKTRITDADGIAADENVVDVGPRTLVLWADAIRKAALILWNGPMGIAEIDAFAAGSRGLARYLGFLPHKAQVVVGGGDTLPILTAAGVIDRISFVSTGGGAMLDFLGQGESLPGLRPLVVKKVGEKS